MSQMSRNRVVVALGLLALVALVLKLSSGAGIHGRVRAFGRPLAGVQVTSPRYQGIVTDEDGEFSIPVDDLGETWFHVWPPFGWDAWRTATIWFPGQVVDFDIDLGSAGTSGVVLDAQTREPIENAVVKLSSAKLWPTDVTGSEGAFFIGPIPPYDYRMSVEAPGYVPVIGDLDLHDGRFAGDLDVVLEAQG